MKTVSALAMSACVALSAACGGSTGSTATLGGPAALPQSFTVEPALLVQAVEFYDTTTNWPVNQSHFGFCETASNSGMIGYAYYRNTNKVSPLFSLFNAHDQPWDFHPKKADVDPRFYLWYGPDLGSLWDFYRDFGFAVFPGTPEDSSPVFTNLWQDLASLQGYTKGSWPQVALTETWQHERDHYDRLVAAGSVVLNFEDVRTQVTAIPRPTGPGERLSTSIADALDSGHLVLVMFRVFEYPVSDALYYQFQSDGNSGSVDAVAPLPYARKNNVWSHGRSGWPVLNGDHWVYLFAYATDATTGSRVFMVRNSWGAGNGENGNYYMTDDFIDGHFQDDGIDVPIVRYPQALRIQVPSR